MQSADPKKSGNQEELVSADASDVPQREDFLRTIKTHMKNGKNSEAYFVVQDAAMEYPDDPVILSYNGLLQALVDRRYRLGVDKCMLALSLIQKEPGLGGKLYSLLYLNLGKAYLAAGKKKEAVDAFHDGLSYNKSSGEILKELRTMGKRKKAVLPFLDRSNPINKLAGLILHSTKKGAAKKK